MSRPKLEKTIQLEREREIRRQRRDLKRIEQEKRKEWRLEKKHRHEIAINGKPVTIASGPIVSIQEIICNGSIHYFCETCKTAKKEGLMKTHDICESCFYADLTGGNSDKPQNDDFTPLPGSGDKKLSLNNAPGSILGGSRGYPETNIQRRAIDSKRPSKGDAHGDDILRDASPELTLSDGRGE